MSKAYLFLAAAHVALPNLATAQAAKNTAPKISPAARAVHDGAIVLDTHFDTPALFSRPGWDIADRHEKGQPVLVATLTPRKYVQPKTREGKWMVKFSGRIWVSESDYQIAKIEMVAQDALTIGLGFVGRVHEGSRLTFARRKVNNEVWLPAEARMEATGRTLLFRSFSFDTITTFSDYRKWSVDTSVTYGLPPKS